jgi:YHS domain-containing protein
VETALYFLLFAALFVVMMRFGCGTHATGHGHRRSSSSEGPGTPASARWRAPERDIDPVCKMTVDTASAKSSVHAGTVYYFCSQDCRETFEAAPGAYVARPATQPRDMEHSHEHHR